MKRMVATVQCNRFVRTDMTFGRMIYSQSFAQEATVRFGGALHVGPRVRHVPAPASIIEEGGARTRL